MKREIKFRVWKSAGYMSSPFTIRDLQEKKIQFTGDCELMQFTGLKDKNGKDIYEGDIIVYSDKSVLLDVAFDEGSFVLKSQGKTYVYNINPKVCEVIGNIHENQELL